MTTTPTPVTSLQITTIGLLLDKLGKRRSVLIASKQAGLKDEPKTALEAAKIIRHLKTQQGT